MIGVVVQARMGSSRLPGKSLRSLSGTPLLGHVLNRLKRSTRGDCLIVATTDLREDDVIVDFATSLNVNVFRGSPHDVLSRYYFCALRFGLHRIVRATGDNPFIDPIELDHLIDAHVSQCFDFTESFSGGLPVGVGCEVMEFSALEQSHFRAVSPDQREHADEFIIQNKCFFSCGVYNAPANKYGPALSFTVDTIDEFNAAEYLLNGHFPNVDAWDIPTEALVSKSLSLAEVLR